MPGFMAKCRRQHCFMGVIKVTWPPYAIWLMILSLCETSCKPGVISQNEGSSAKGAFAFSRWGLSRAPCQMGPRQFQQHWTRERTARVELPALHKGQLQSPRPLWAPLQTGSYWVVAQKKSVYDTQKWQYLTTSKIQRGLNSLCLEILI